jgi:hypothetical protein
MAQTGATPISLYYTTTVSAVPTAANLIAGELAININTADGKLFYKDSAGVVQVLASKGSGTIGGSTTQVQYNNAGALAGSANFVWDNTNARLGIGTTTPNQKLQVNGGIQLAASATLGATNNQVLSFETPVTRYYLGDGTGYSWAFSNRSASTTTDLVTIQDSGNVGIGTSSPGFKLDVNGAIKVVGDGSSVAMYASADQALRQIGTSGGTWYFDVATGGSTNGSFVWRSSNAYNERMRIDSSGNIQLQQTIDVGRGTNTTSALNVRAIIRYVGGGTQYGMQFIPTNNTTTAIQFSNAAGSDIGSISCTATVTTYNVTSDYRLKENVAPMTGALETVAKLKPVTYNWKVDGSAGQGFIAHELQAVVPDCVTGEKDAMRTEKYEISPAIEAKVDENGKVLKEAVEAVMGEREVPKYQGIDTSFLVATLVSAIQELKAEVDALKAVK